MNQRFKKMLLCLLIITILCAVYELWLAPYLAVLSGQPVRESAQAQASPPDAIALQSADGAPAEAAGPKLTITKKELGMDENHITYYEVDLQLSDARDLKAALAHDKYGQNIKDTLSSMAEEHQASFAVNGDFYGYRSDGIVIRNGVLYRDKPSDRECLVLYQDGTAGVIRESDTSGQELLDAGAWNVLSFGPVLVENGVPREDLKDGYKVDDRNMDISGPEPRTAIGYIEKNHYLILVADGRQTGYSRGMDFEEMAKVFTEHGCSLAYNLDGGGSVTLYSEGEIINQPCALVGKERSISDILYVEENGQSNPGADSGL